MVRTHAHLICTKTDYKTKAEESERGGRATILGGPSFKYRRWMGENRARRGTAVARVCTKSLCLYSTFDYWSSGSLHTHLGISSGSEWIAVSFFRVHLINYLHWVQRLCVGHETMIINCEISDTARRKWAIFQLTAFVECYWKSIDVFSTLRTVIPIFTRLLRRFYGSEKKWIHLLAIFEKKLVKCRKRPVELFWFFVHIKTYENARGFQLSPYSSVTCFGRRIRIADHIVATIWKSNDHPIHFCLAMNFLWSWATWTERMLLPSRIYECKIQLLVVFFSNRLTIYSNFRLHHD